MNPASIGRGTKFWNWNEKARTELDTTFTCKRTTNIKSDCGCVWVCVCVCEREIWVCEREREREREGKEMPLYPEHWHYYYLNCPTQFLGVHFIAGTSSARRRRSWFKLSFKLLHRVLSHDVWYVRRKLDHYHTTHWYVGKKLDRLNKCHEQDSWLSVEWR